MKRVLLSAPFDKPWSNGPYLETALRELGCDVWRFDFRSSPDPNEQIVRMAENFSPALHIIWKGEAYLPETLHRLSELGTYSVLWHPDISLPPWLPALAQAADLCCVQSRAMLDPFCRAGIRDPQWLMEGVTPSCFAYDTITPAEWRKYECDVGLIGTVDHVPGYLRRLWALERLMREGWHVKWWGRRVSLLRNPVRAWLSPARRAWGGGPVWGPSYAKACHCAKILLTLPPDPQAPGGLSNGAFMATGVGAFYLSLYRQGMEEFFDLGREVVAFHDEDEMVEKVRYYLSHEEERRAVAEAGRQRTLGNYTNHHAFRRLFSIIAGRGGPRA